MLASLGLLPAVAGLLAALGCWLGGLIVPLSNHAAFDPQRTCCSGRNVSRVSCEGQKGKRPKGGKAISVRSIG